MANPAPTINQINAFNATQGTTIDFNIIGGTELVRSNRIYIYDLSDNSLICTHLYVSTESIHELPPNTDGSIVYESGKSSADFVNGKQYYAQIQTFTDIAGTQGGSGLSVSKLFWCLVDPSLTIATIPSSISTTSYNVSATYDANTSVVSNIIQQYQFSLYSATGSLLQSSGVVVGSGTQQGTSTAYDISYNFSGLSVGSSYYVVVDVTTTQGMSISAQSSTFTVSIDTPTLGEATVVNNACDGYISVTSNLSSEYGGSASGEIATFETDSVNNVTKLEVTLEPTQLGEGTPSPSNVRPIVGHSEVEAKIVGKNLFDKNSIVFEKSVILADGSISTSAQFINSYRHTVDYIRVKPSTDYVFSGNLTSSSTYNSVAFYDEDRTFISRYAQSTIATPAQFTTPNNCAYIRFNVGVDNTGLHVDTIQLEEGTTATEYEPYQEIKTEESFNVTLTPTVIDETPYLFKQTGDVRGDRESLELVGGTVNWNQLAKYNARTGTVSGISYTVASDGTVTLSAGTTTGVIGFNADASFTGKLNHVLYISGCPSGGEDGKYYFRDGYQSGSASLDIGNGKIIKKTQSDNLIGQIYIASGITVPTLTFKPQIIDLTAFFGNSSIADYVYSLETANAGAGVAWLRKYFPDLSAYSPYNAGTLESVKPTAHVTRGVNQWDEEIQTGRWSNTVGSVCSFVTDSTRYCNKTPISVLPNTTYYVKTPDILIIMLCDANMNVLSIFNTAAGSSFTTQSNCAYICFYPYVTGLTYNNDICINISNPSINGQYFSYEHHTYPITELELRGIPKLVDGELRFDGDTRKADGTVNRRYEERAYQSGDESLADAITDGTKTVVKKTTPTTETADPFTDPQEVSIYGTEEFVSSNGVPVGNKTTYKTRDIFGGTIDLASGVLTVDRVSVLLNGQTDGLRFTEVSQATTADGTKYVAYIPLNSFGMKLNNMALCDLYTFKDELINNIHVGEFDARGSYMRFVIADQTLDTLIKWNAYLANNPMQLVYELATPLTYQLTPHEIETLVGSNNVWSNAGDVLIEFNIPITNLLVKRQDVDDVSGNWLTLYSQPVEQASDMDFTFIDFLNQYGKTYKYALVPLLTQTQSGVEVEVEGGYTVSDEVQSIFDGVYIGDSTGVQRLKAGVAYNNLNTNQQVGVIPTLGNKYPVIVSNGNIQYDTGSVSGLIVPDDFYSNGNLSRIDMSDKREAINDFLTNKKPKILKDWNGNIWLVVFTDNVDVSFDNNYGMGIATFTSGWTEVGDPTNQEDLQRTGLINVGGD